VLEYLLTYDAYLIVHASAVDNVLHIFRAVNLMRVSYYCVITVAAFNLNLFACLVNHNVSSHAVAVVLSKKNWECHCILYLLIYVLKDVRWSVAPLFVLVVE
jgi:hypothetical protein